VSPLGRSTILCVCSALAAVCGCGDDDFSRQPVAVLSAFPAELAAYLEQATVSETVVVGGKVFRRGVLGGVPVIMGLTGIGLLNATMTTRAVLDRFAVRGVVVSGVAGSPLLIGDVTVPATWTRADGMSYAAHPEWLEVARELAADDTVPLDSCTLVPSKSDAPVCILGEPAIVVGGSGYSSDPFGTTPFPCQPNGNDLYGCDVAPGGTSAVTAVTRRTVTTLAAATPGPTPVATDMETAAIAGEAAAHAVPFIAFRAVSDGAGDPLKLGSFPFQFAAYYHLAAHNAAAATVAFLEWLAGAPRSGAAGSPVVG
jgi:nucleoside phosphorylase